MLTGIDNNEGDADGWFVQKLFFAKPVVAKTCALTKCVTRFGLASSKVWAVPAIEFSFRRAIPHA